MGTGSIGIWSRGALLGLRSLWVWIFGSHNMISLCMKRAARMIGKRVRRGREDGRGLLSFMNTSPLQILGRIPEKAVGSY